LLKNTKEQSSWCLRVNFVKTGVNMDFFDIVEKRRSIRSFKDKQIEKEKLDKILNAAYLAPSAGNLQARKILVITKPEEKKQLCEASLGQNCLKEAPVILVFFAIPKESEQKFGARGRELYAMQDATIACTFANLAATALGLASVWVGAFHEDSIIKALSAPVDCVPVAMLPIGYANEKPKERSRKNWEDIFVKEKFE